MAAAAITARTGVRTCHELPAVMLCIVSLPSCSCCDRDPENEVGQAQAGPSWRLETIETRNRPTDIVEKSPAPRMLTCACRNACDALHLRLRANWYNVQGERLKWHGRNY